MRGSPCQVEGVLDETTSIKPFSDGGEVVPLLSSIQYCNKFSTDKKRRERSEASLLYQSGILRSKIKLPKDGEDSFRINGRLKLRPYF